MIASSESGLDLGILIFCLDIFGCGINKRLRWRISSVNGMASAGNAARQSPDQAQKDEELKGKHERTKLA